MERKQATLAPYRVLDPTSEIGFLCGKILADLGADVIKKEIFLKLLQNSDILLEPFIPGFLDELGHRERRIREA